MYIIVVGGGEVGYHLSKALLSEGHEVTILEKKTSRYETLAEELGEVAVRGDGCEARTLEETGASRADVLVAVTGDDEDNLVSCQVAKHRFHVARTIARIKNPRNRAIFEKLGIDVTVSSTDLILAHIKHELPSHPLVPLLELRDKGLEVVGVKIPSGSMAVGKKLGDFKLPGKCLVCLIIGKDKAPRLPSMDSNLEADDEVVAVADPDTVKELSSVLLGKAPPST